MVEATLLVKAGMLVKGITWTGYGVAVAYFVGACKRYVDDYKNSVEAEKEAER